MRAVDARLTRSVCGWKNIALTTDDIVRNRDTIYAPIRRSMLQRCIPHTVQRYQSNRECCPACVNLPRSRDDVIIAFIPLAAIGTFPILVPYIRAIIHIILLYSFTLLLGRTPFRDVKLLFRTSRPIGRAAPFDFRETRVLTLLASFGAFQTLLPVTFLIGTHVTFQGVAEREETRDEQQAIKS